MAVITWVADSAAGEQRMEQAHVRTGSDGVSARGIALVGTGELTEPDGPFTLAYELETDVDFVTRRLRVTTNGEDWQRSLELTRDQATGTWTDGSGAELPELADALDCDLVSSALFNMMPIARSGLHERPGRQEFLMAWVSVPDLVVTPARQVYGHVRPGEVSFRSEDGFTAEIEVDPDGFALRYPLVAVRV
jgi:uncharacterized protein